MAALAVVEVVAGPVGFAAVAGSHEIGPGAGDSWAGARSRFPRTAAAAQCAQKLQLIGIMMQYFFVYNMVK